MKFFISFSLFYFCLSLNGAYAENWIQLDQEDVVFAITADSVDTDSLRVEGDKRSFWFRSSYKYAPEAERPASSDYFYVDLICATGKMILRDKNTGSNNKELKINTWYDYEQLFTFKTKEFVCAKSNN